MKTTVMTEFFGAPWAITPEKHAQIAAFLRDRAAGIRMSDEEVRARFSAVDSQRYETTGSIAVIPVYGVIAQRMNLLHAFSGGTSTEILSREIKAAVADPDVSAVVLDVDSPGGSVYGVQELGDEIRAAREEKPIVAVANSMAASAAYWIASQASEVVVTPSGDVGSIGVIIEHHDWSEHVGPDGGLPRVTYITAGEYKAEGNSMEPLSDEALAFYQRRVNEYYEAFVSAVASGRGVSAETVLSDFGGGRIYGAQAALDAGMVDRIDTLDNVIAGLRSGAVQDRPRRNRRAAAMRAMALAERI